jgi:hypothetical protein
VNSRHPLVGKWIEVDDHFGPTPVAFTIAADAEGCRVSGADLDDGTILRITRTSWDGEALRFTSYYPPTKHSARNELRLATPRRAKMRVRYSDECGKHEIHENWKRVKR